MKKTNVGGSQPDWPTEKTKDRWLTVAARNAVSNL
jgi:hypothetical protein